MHHTTRSNYFENVRFCVFEFVTSFNYVLSKNVWSKNLKASQRKKIIKFQIKTVTWQVTNSVVWCTLRSLTLRREAHGRVWLRCVPPTTEFFQILCFHDSAEWGAPRSFLKIWISQRNWKCIRKYFSLFIRGLDGFESGKNRDRKSCNTLPLRPPSLT